MWGKSVRGRGMGNSGEATMVLWKLWNTCAMWVDIWCMLDWIMSKILEKLGGLGWGSEMAWWEQ